MKDKLMQVLAIIGISCIVVLIGLCGVVFLEQKVYCNVILKQKIEVENLKKEPVENLTVWEEIRGLTFSNPMLDNDCVGDCVYVVGALEQLQAWEVVDGTLFLDEESVIISSKMAQQLFHSEYVVGQKIQYGDQSFSVRGVVDEHRCKVYMAAAVLSIDTDMYKWIPEVLEKNIGLTHVTYAVEKKKCLFKNITDEMRFMLQKNGYPEIDMIL